MLPSPATTARSHATVCSLRPAGSSGNHPLRQNPPSTSSSTPDQTLRLVHDALGKPPAALLTTPSTSYDPAALDLLDHRPPTAFVHPKSLSTTLLDNCRPLVQRATSSISQLQHSRSSVPSPTKTLASFVPSRRDPAAIPEHRDNDDAPPKPAARNSTLFGDWFNGNSAPCHIGVARGDPPDSESDIGSDSDVEAGGDFDSMDPIGTYTRPPPSMGRARSSNSVKGMSITPQPAPAPSKFSSWFSRQPAAAKPDPNLPQDPLVVLDIDKALFPHGPPDPLDPASFNNLLQSSTALLQQFQASYRAIQLAMQDTRLEEDAAREEKKQAETRVQQLQMQLDGLKAEAEQRETEMQALRQDLEAERQLRQDEEEARIGSVRAIRGPGCDCGKRKSTASTGTIEPSGVLSDRDSGFESEGETIAVGDRSRPASMLSEADESVPEIEPMRSNPASARNSTFKPGMVKRKSTFDRTLQQKRGQRGSTIINTNTTNSNNNIIMNVGPGKVAQIRGGQADVWRENRELRERVDVLERSVDEVLGIVGGLHAGIVW